MANQLAHVSQSSSLSPMRLQQDQLLVAQLRAVATRAIIPVPALTVACPVDMVRQQLGDLDIKYQEALKNLEIERFNREQLGQALRQSAQVHHSACASVRDAGYVLMVKQCAQATQAQEQLERVVHTLLEERRMNNANRNQERERMLVVQQTQLNRAMEAVETARALSVCLDAANAQNAQNAQVRVELVTANEQVKALTELLSAEKAARALLAI